MKPKYTFFYNSREKLEYLLNSFPFYDEEREIYKLSKDDEIYIYEHFDLVCYKKINMGMRGHRTWAIIIDEELYNSLDEEIIECVLKPMIITPMGNIIIF